MSNLDPMGTHPPEELWDALQRVQLTHTVRRRRASSRRLPSLAAY